jgi:membrane-bound lytic murein transglycosylase D
MKCLITIFLAISTLVSVAQTNATVDTIIIDTAFESASLQEINTTRTVPQKEKVQYFSQVTKYGFKNLFSNYQYNTSLPYTTQINPNASVFIQDYMRGHGKYLTNMKTWGQPYFSLIENILQQYGLPKELKYIAVIESNLSTAATSSVGAGGPWQFMPYTAREYGLVVNGYVDERRDYYKSTHAAARYLLTLYHQMHDWLLVMAAYNGGPGRVTNAIKKSGSRSFWNLQYHLPEESRTYVKRFIATHYIMEGAGGVTTNGSNNEMQIVNNSKFGFGKENYQRPDLTEEELADVEMLQISGKYNSIIIAKNLAIEIALFNHYNPNFDLAISTDGNYNLRLPADKMELFIANKYTILNECVQQLLGGAVMPTNKTVYNKLKPSKKQ